MIKTINKNQQIYFINIYIKLLKTSLKLRTYCESN